MIKKTRKNSRIGVFVASILVLCMMFSMIGYADTIQSTSEPNDWAANGWSRIHENENFQQDISLKRGELLSLINSLFNFNEKSEISFSDVDSQSPYFKEVSKAFNAGYIIGRGNNIFDSEAYVTKTEAYIMIARILNLDTKQPVEQMLKFKDASEVPDWATGEIEALTRYGVIGDKSKVKPFEQLTGEEAVALLEKAYSEENVPDVETPVEETKNDGKASLNLLGAYFVTIDNNQSTEICEIEEGSSDENSIIKLVFDRGIVREYWENNEGQIKLQGNNGEEIEGEVFRIEDSDFEKSNIFIKTSADLKSGKTVNIIIGKDLKANNGNILGEEQVISFKVK